MSPYYDKNKHIWLKVGCPTASIDKGFSLGNFPVDILCQAKQLEDKIILFLKQQDMVFL